MGGGPAHYPCPSAADARLQTGGEDKLPSLRSTLQGQALLGLTRAGSQGW